MTQEIILLGVGIGLIIVSVFVPFMHFKRKTTPDLPQAISLMLSGVGIVTGIHLGYTLLTAAKTDLGVLDGHQIPIVVGALAIVWVSVARIISAFRGNPPSDKEDSDD